MRMLDVLEHKRCKKELTDAEISFFVHGFTSGQIPDYQAAALLMAICLNGMTEQETANLTDCMAHSGDMLDLSDLGETTADKHSTGGVGDKTTLIIAPICAAAGVKIAKMSGRGLGHTGGTIDKLESIPGFRVSLSETEFKTQVQTIGIAVMGQTADLAPADKKLYALRDASGTVNSIPLIASSIMSKKLAAGAKNIALDVKCGSGAFMQTVDDARALAEEMVRIGKACGRNTAAVITDMDTPLGTHIGNALEVTEACTVLRGKGANDLRELCLILSAHLIAMAKQTDYDTAYCTARRVLQSGEAFKKLRQMVTAQGGDASVLERDTCFLQAAVAHEVKAPKDGFIAHMQTQTVGESASLLGAGRETKESKLDYAAGIVLHKKTGDFVKQGETLATLYAATDEKCRAGEQRFLESLTFSEKQPRKMPLVLGTVE
ncbi:MAG: thymidine phosphorylase [Candidatus Fimenecus sp.]